MPGCNDYSRFDKIDDPDDDRRVDEVLAQKADGNAKLKRGDLEGAAKVYSMALREVASWDISKAKLDEEETEARIALLTNRALVYIKLGRHDVALSDCNQVLEMDGARIKALFRRGQAFEGLQQPEKAIHAWMKLLKIDPGNTLAAKSISRLEKKAHGQTLKNLIAKDKREEEKKKADAEREELRKRKEAAKKREKGNKTLSPSSSSSSNSSSARTGAKTSSRADDVVRDNSDVGIVRGYKIRSDGRKTSYFDTERSEKEKSLIGDITPRRIDPAAGKKSGGEGDQVGGGGGPGGAYEEKNVSEWAQDALKTGLLAATSFGPATGEWVARVTGVSDLNGDAEIVVNRVGKRRHLFEFSFTLKWEVTFANGSPKKVRGSLKYADITALDDEIDQADFSFEGNVDTDSVRSGADIRRAVGLQGKGLQKNVAEQIRAFAATFNKM